jgi:hypothetical protein
MRLKFSFDDGATWQTVKSSMYYGNSYMYGNGYFNKLSRPVDWKYTPINNTNFIWTNANANWAVEIFDFSGALSNIVPSPDSVMFRIELEDGGGSATGSVGTHRYYLDDFLVKGTPTIVGLNSKHVSSIELNVYPNPASNQLFLQGLNRLDVEVLIRNIEGKLMKRKRLMDQENQMIEISSLESGVYSVEVRSNTIAENQVLKFIKK